MFYRNVRDSIKAYDKNLIVSSSPSLYPWSYEGYLQDSKTWVDSGIVDNIIPQVYRKSFEEYIYELDRSLANFPEFTDRYFAGMVIKVGLYLIEPKFLLDALAENRNRGILGEAFFFYEGLRANNNLLGDTLKATFYAGPTRQPHRPGNIWRPPALIANEDDDDAQSFGTWRTSSITGFKPGILINESSTLAWIDYYFELPFAAWFNVYAYIVNGPLAARQALFTVYNAMDSSQMVIDQTDAYIQGWQKIGTCYLEPGLRRVLRLDNSLRLEAEKLTADAAMVMINRKLSPDVIVSSLGAKEVVTTQSPDFFTLNQNYPNPFNGSTTIRYEIHRPGNVSLTIYDLQGKKIRELINRRQTPGAYTYSFNADKLASGVYFFQLRYGFRQQTRKMMLLQ